jgi:hypothetical protein
MNKNIVPSEKKVQLIGFIDFYSSKFVKKSLIVKELNQMRNKYIYKDICLDEFKKDKKYLKDVKEILEMN